MNLPTIDDVFDLADPGSDEVVEMRLTLLGQAVDEPQVLGRFTDEELVALADPGAEPATPSPWYTSLTPAEREVAITAALRGLTARGVYVATPVDAGTGEFTFRTAPEILALLTMRRYAGCVVVAERRTADTTDWAVLFQQRAGMWLTEYVTHVGQHEFVLSTGEAAADTLTVWSGASPDAPTPGLDVTLTREQVAEQDAALEPVGRATAAVTVTRLDLGEPTEETWSGVFTGTEGSYVSTATEDDRVRYVGVPADGVREHWRAALDVE